MSAKVAWSAAKVTMLRAIGNATMVKRRLGVDGFNRLHVQFLIDRGLVELVDGAPLLTARGWRAFEKLPPPKNPPRTTLFSRG